MKLKRCCVALLFASTYAFSSEQSLTIYTEEFPPYNFLEKGVVVGVNADIVAMACKMANIECEFALYPWKRAMTLSLKDDRSALVSTSRLPSREQKFQWVGPLISSPACFYKLAERDDIQIHNKEELANYTVALHKGDAYEEILKQWGYKEHINYIPFFEKFDEIKAFTEGKLDLFIASANSLRFHVQNYRLREDQVTPAFVINDPRLGGNYLALNKAVPKDMVLRLQNAVDEIYAKELDLPIKNRYLETVTQISEQELTLETRCTHQ